MEIAELKYPDELDEYYDLRWRILRKPFGQPEGSERDEAEATSIHLAIMENGKMEACCRLHFNSPQQAQLRYMAVEESLQRKGIGSKLLEASEEKVKNLGAKELILEARDTAVDFYRKNGYVIVDKSHKNYGIQHFTMRKPFNEY